MIIGGAARRMGLDQALSFVREYMIQRERTGILPAPCSVPDNAQEKEGKSAGT